MDNKGYKVATIILIVILLFQSCGTSSSISNMEDRLNQNNQKLREMEDRLNYFESEIEENVLSDDSFGIENINFKEEYIKFSFSVEPRDVSNDTRVVLTNGIESVEMERKGNEFVGTLQYPLDDKLYNTSYKIYEGEVETGNQYIDSIGASLWMYKAAMADFYGEIMYGNGKLTLAGGLKYYLNIDDKIESAKFVFADNTIDLGTSTEDVVDINFSEKISVDEENNFSELYIELVLESGDIYKIYPYLEACTVFYVDESFNKDTFVNQRQGVIITTSEGKEYKIFD
ncbi:MAG: hypothetical protein J6L69_07795 [Lachnospiraceae bacterium]|nr:hypothetical protein [Lachnospiraceae bacterium]